MLASVHIADLDLRAALTLVTTRKSKLATPGLRHANFGLTAMLGRGLPPKPDLHRVALVAMWDDDRALDGFLERSPVATAFADGWSTRLQPLRAHGSWPGLPNDLPKSRAADESGPVAVLTMGRNRFSRLVPFLRTSAKAEASVVVAPGLIWATGIARPPFFATCSLWQSGVASAAYAYAAGDAHDRAIAVDRAKPFHHEEAFVRFRPYAARGHLDGRNPLSESGLAGV
jgi:hypothetical protein